MTDVQYRCFPCQAVFDAIPEWREHSLTAHGENIFKAAGVQDPPPAEERLPEDDPYALSGVRAIINHTYAMVQVLRDDVKAAIRARLAVDADPWWYMSDDYSVRPLAKLTPRGREVAHAQGYLQKCIDHVDNGGACRQEILSQAHGGRTDRCSNCTASLSQFGPPTPGLPVPEYLCGMCTVTVMRRTDPTYVLPRRR